MMHIKFDLWFKFVLHPGNDFDLLVPHARCADVFRKVIFRQTITIYIEGQKKKVAI